MLCDILNVLAMRHVWCVVHIRHLARLKLLLHTKQHEKAAEL